MIGIRKQKKSNKMIYILLLTFFLKGGLIETTTVLSWSKTDCEAAEPLIVKEYQTTGSVKLDSKTIPIVKIKSQCIQVSETDE